MAHARWRLEEETRRDRRFLVDIEAELLFGRRRAVVRMRDISRSGAMIEADGLPEAGTEVVLARNGIEVVATVAWHTGAMRGLTFHRTIEPGALLGKARVRARNDMPAGADW